MHDIVPGCCHLIDQHVVHFFPVFIQGIIFHADQYVLLKLRTADAFVIDNDLHLDFRTETAYKFHVFTKAELESRAEIQYEIYAKAINIEAKTMIDIATKQIIPAVISIHILLTTSLDTLG